MTASEKGGGEPASGRGSGKEPKAGGWFAAQEEEEKEDGKSKRYSDAEGNNDDHDDASKDSGTDNTLSSKRRYDGKGGHLLQRGSSDEGQVQDEGEGNGHDRVGGGCWGELYEKMPARCNSLMLSYERGNTSDLVQCIIVRDVSR